MLIGIIGKPSTGKSTFLKAATLAEVEISVRPFTTLKPFEAEGYVKVDCVDKEFDVECDSRYGFCLEGKRFVPVKLMDVPGLVEGAHEGKGMGNQFLDSLNEADALIHIVDISGSTDADGNPVGKLSYDPENDVKFLEGELDQWYLRILKKGWEKFSRRVKQENLDVKKALAKQMSGLRVNEEIANEAVKELDLSHVPTGWSEEDLLGLASELRKRTKPIVIAANKIDIEGAKMNFEKLKEKYEMIACSAEVELALREAAKHELIKYVPGEGEFEIVKEKEDKLSIDKKKGLYFIEEFLEKNKTTGVQEVLNKIVFDVLKYIAVWPVMHNLKDKDGRYLPDCLLMENNSTALDLAYRIHQDIGKNFIKGIDVKNKRPLGKDYVLKNRDIIEIKTKN